MPEFYIAGLRTQLEKFKEQANKDEEMFCYLNDEKVSKLLEQAQTIKIFFKALKVKTELVQELNSIINQIQDFNNYVNSFKTSKFNESL